MCTESIFFYGNIKKRNIHTQRGKERKKADKSNRKFDAYDDYNFSFFYSYPAFIKLLYLHTTRASRTDCAKIERTVTYKTEEKS